MKKVSHANRGLELEKTVLNLFKHYEERGIFCHQIEVKEYNGVRVKKAPFDFEVFYKNTFYAFDTKESKDYRLGIANLKLHQIKALSDVERNGGDAFFLIYFRGPKKLNKLSVADARQMLQDDVKSVEYSEERNTKLDFLGIL